MSITQQLIHQYNTLPQEQQSRLISKALSSAVGVGQGLIPEQLSKEITNTIIRLAPELALLTTKKISGKFFDFNRLIKLPQQGGAQGETSSTYESNSQTVRANVELKIIKRKGAITNFLADSSEEFIDAAAYEIENHLQQHVYDLIHYFLFGNKSSNIYEFDGLDSLVVTNRIPVSNTTKRYGDTLSSLSIIDSVIDRSTRAGGRGHNRVLLCSPELLSKISQLLTNVRLNQGLVGGLTQVEIPGGWRLNAYRDIPIIETTSTRPTSVSYGTVTATTATTGGTIPASTYYFELSAVTQEGGEQLSSNEATIVTTGATSTITINFTDVDGAYKYKLYSSSASGGDKTLVRCFNADTYDSQGKIIGRATSITLTTNPLVRDSSVPDALQYDVQFKKESGHDVPEYFYLWDLDPVQGLGFAPYTNTGGSRFDGLVTIEQLARIDDYLNVLLKSYVALAPRFEKSTVLYRGLRTF